MSIIANNAEIVWTTEEGGFWLKSRCCEAFFEAWCGLRTGMQFDYRTKRVYIEGVGQWQLHFCPYCSSRIKVSQDISLQPGESVSWLKPPAPTVLEALTKLVQAQGKVLSFMPSHTRETDAGLRLGFAEVREAEEALGKALNAERSKNG